MKRATTGSYRVCARCGKDVHVTEGRHTRAHLCPHGKHCERSYEQRLRGVGREHCEACFEARQTEMFGGGAQLTLGFPGATKAQKAQ